MARQVLDSMTQSQLIMSSLQARGFLRSARSLYDNAREGKFGEVSTNEHFIMQGVDGTNYSWADMNAIHVNIGLSLELILKRIEYYDQGQFEYGHKLVEIYDSLGDEISERIDSVYSKVLEEFGGFNIVGMMIKDTLLDIPDKPEDIPLNNFRDILEYVDKEDILYSRRYECFSLEKDKWYFFLDKLEPIFACLERLLWLHKKDVFNESDN